MLIQLIGIIPNGQHTCIINISLCGVFIIERSKEKEIKKGEEYSPPFFILKPII
jgi:hypothetical protein